jgi:GT2 family glycosyltransferase
MSPFQVDSAEIPQLCWGAFPTFFSDLKRKRLQKKLDKFNVSAIRKMNRIRNKGNCFSVGWVSGSTMLLRDAAIGEAGLFDDKIFMFFEDIDICTRVRRAGWRVVVDPMVVVIHHRGESAKKDRFNSSMHYRRSHLYFWQKYHSSSSVFLLKVYLFIKFSYRILNLNIKYYFKKIDRNYLIEEKKLAKGLRRIIFH